MNREQTILCKSNIDILIISLRCISRSEWLVLKVSVYLPLLEIAKQYSKVFVPL